MPIVNAAGVQGFVDIRGSGAPVAVLHGSLLGGSSMSALVEPLARDYRVLVPDRSGHGRTPDGPGPYTYPGLADETIAVLEELGNGPVHLIGASSGAVVALHVVVRRPDLIASAVFIGGCFHLDGLVDWFVPSIAATDPDDDGFLDRRTRYAEESPDGDDHWPVLIAKTVDLLCNGPTLSTADLESIPCPVLVIGADHDVVRIDHTVAMFQTIPISRLAVVPGTTHGLMDQEPHTVLRLVQEFLADAVAGELTAMSPSW